VTLPAIDLAMALRAAPLFSGLPPDDLAEIVSIASLRRFGRGETIFREGDRADGFYVVASGKAKVFKLSAEGKEQVLHLLEPGHSFAEGVIFEGGAFPAHASAITDAVLIFLPKMGIISLLERSPRLAIRMLASLSKWLRRMTDLVDDLALKDVETRFTWFVSEELRERGIPVADGAVYELGFSKSILASRLGTVPETFSRTLKKLQDDGAIRVQGKRIRILAAAAFLSPLDRQG
jgi:CRP/FNR family transcriptional regulator